ncbi:unnamed protein product [Effrenium voratum]|nr:unnamed protein product [Effrenium voratum]
MKAIVFEGVQLFQRPCLTQHSRARFCNHFLRFLFGVGLVPVGSSRVPYSFFASGLLGLDPMGLEHLGAAFRGDFERKARGETPKQLQYSRAFGGKDLQPYGLSNQPDIKQMVLDVRHKVLILASDGLWDVCSEERAVCLAHDVADRGLDPAQALVEQALVENRFLRTRADNITVVAVTFN